MVEPFRVFDCAYEVDGAVALVLASADRAGDLRHPPVYPIGAAEGTGAVGDYFREGRATYGGDVVVNPHGGLVSEGYLHGLNHHYEAVHQLRGDVGICQVDGAELALVIAGAGPYGGAIVHGRHRP